MTVASELDRCPPSEVLAAFVEGRLSRNAVVALTEHLSSCAECRFVVESAYEAQEEEPRVARRWWLYAAAAIAVVIAVGPFAYTNWEIRQRNTAVREIVNAAPSGHRVAEPRLTGMSNYAPPKSVFRSANPEEETTDEIILDSKASAVLQMTARDHSPEGSRARGIANLVARNKQDAVADLQAVTSAQPNDAKAWSDLSAALYVAGRFPEAHAAAEHALALNPNLNEARFNRALSSYGDDKASIAEWNDYLKHDPTSPWAKEAREKLELLTPEK